MSLLEEAHGELACLAGVARADITPPPDIYARNWGAAEHDAAEGIHRPLTLTALVASDGAGGEPLALVAADLGWWRGPDEERRVRQAVLETLGAGQAMVALSHTHAGPSTCLADADRPGGQAIAAYIDLLCERARAAVRRAREALAPAIVSWTYGKCGLARHRDLPEPGGARLLCGFHPGGPSDDTLLVGRVSAPDGRVRATIVNYACHPTSLAWANRLISPDYVGACREVMEAASAGAPCLFLQGASGELAPREQYASDPSVADRNGRVLGLAAASALEGMLPPATALTFDRALESGAPLGLWRRGPRAPSAVLRARTIAVKVLLKTLPSAAELRAQEAACPERVLAERLRRKRTIREAVGDGATAELPFWLWRMGDAVLVGHANEAYSDLQRSLRARFAPRPVAVINLVNGPCLGYLPPAALYDDDVYQVWQTPLARGSLERVVAEVGNAVDALLAE
ncbi:MAG: hypothetical protein IT208_18975 [Chthonomonadales bacterium]|nr:hypothetical protein [Chthonomonadales bacterium]